MKETAYCDLCRLPVEDDRFFLDTPEKRLRFCCEGCKGIYMLLHDIGEQPPQVPKTDPSKNKETP